MPRTRPADFAITDEHLPWETTDESFTDSSAPAEPGAISREECPDETDPWATTAGAPVGECDEDPPRVASPSLDRLVPDWDDEPDSHESAAGDQTRATRLGRSWLAVAGSLALVVVVAVVALINAHGRTVDRSRRVLAATPHRASQRPVILSASATPAGQPARHAAHGSSRNSNAAKPRSRTRPPATHRPAPKHHTATSSSAPSIAATPVQTASPPVAQPAQATTSSESAPAPSAPVTAVPARAPVRQSSPASEFSFER